MRILIVKLSSLGDVVHAMPVVHDLRAAFPGVVIDWVVEPGFAPLVQRVRGVADCIECPLRRWSRNWWTGATRAEWRRFRQRLRQERYEAVLDLQGLTKSAVIARLAHGVSYGLANRTEGASHEPPARWLIDRSIAVPERITAVDRSRLLAARALGYVPPSGPPCFGLEARAAIPADAPVLVPARQPTLAFIHGSSRDDKLWPEDHWIAFGRRAVDAGWRLALPHAGEAERARAERLAAALGGPAVADVWPAMSLDALLDRLAATQGAVGVDSGLSHVAVALGLPNVQLYNFATAWRTGPPMAGGEAASRQVSVEGTPWPTVDEAWAAWQDVIEAVAA